MKAIDWLAARITGALHVVATLMLLAIVLINGVNVVGRYVFNRPMETADEVMIFLLTVAVFLCLPRCTYENEHIRMDLIRNHITGWVRKVWDLVIELLHLAMMVLVLYIGLPTVAKLFSWGQVSDAAKIPMWIVHSVIPIGFGLAGAILVLRIVQMVREGEGS